MSSEKLWVTDQVEIKAPPEKVWEVLTLPEFIRQWDDVPENYRGGQLELNSVLEWEGFSKMTVTELDAPNKLILNLFLPMVDLRPDQYNTNYSFSLEGENGSTWLKLEIGDFSPLPNARDYYEAATEWAESATQKIKELSENE